VSKTIERALLNAGVGAREIGAISAAANGGVILDRIETAAYTEVFEGRKLRPLITSLKGALGESFSGGGMRCCALALSLDKGMLPPTVGLLKPMAALNFLHKQTEKTEINNALLAGISFGGTYVYLVLGSCPVYGE
jgi:3-oxoacyl-(acyl-carrier-protein) synthase